MIKCGGFMKTVFVINPMAGKGKKIEKLTSDIYAVAERLGKETECYVTKYQGDATRFVKEYVGSARFIACGGDGTFSEVLNAVIDKAGSEAGVMPIGTGNDFCRNFKDCNFESIEAQFLGETVPCDAIMYKTSDKAGYCANMFNIGFDCNVADKTSQIKKTTFLRGSFAYFMSIFIMLIKKKGANLFIELDGKPVHHGKLLLTSLANGSYCGGGIKSNPLSNVSDGVMNVNIVNNISRLKFISLLPFYMKGTHIKLKNIQNVIYSQDVKKATITPLDKNMRICVDGEIFDAGKTEFEVIPDAYRLVLPNFIQTKKQILSELQ